MEQSDKPGLAGKNHKEKGLGLYKEDLKPSNIPQHETESLGGRKVSKHRLDDYLAEMSAPSLDNLRSSRSTKSTF